jgi:transposase-like protein
MPQHFLLSPAARALTLASVARMGDEEAERVFIRLRWADNDGRAYCPKCGCREVYQSRRKGLLRFQCKACHKDFSLTSGTLFASRKLSLRGYLMAIAVFVNEVKGKSMLALSRDLGVSYKASYVLAHKLREAMATEVQATPVGGEGKQAEIDAGWFGGYVKPANRKADRVDRRRAVNQTGKRKAVVIIRERGEGGKTLPGVFRNEADALTFIRQNLPAATTLYADEAAAWNALHARYALHRINHQEAYSLRDGAQTHTNNAEGFFSRMRRGEIGHHHHVAGPYLIRFAQEFAWRETHKRLSNGDQVDKVVSLAMNARKSREFCGYWQRHVKVAA